MSFWDLPACSVLDTLNEKDHTDKIIEALGDRETGISFNDPEYITIYGKEEALLLRLSSFRMWFLTFVCWSFSFRKV